MIGIVVLGIILVLLICFLNKSKSSQQDATFNIIKNSDLADQYFQAVALMNNAGFKCTRITFSREGLYTELFRLTASIQGQGLGIILKNLTEFLTKENNRIEQEFQIKSNSCYGVGTTARIYDETNEERKKFQGQVTDEFFKSVLKQADTASNRELIGSPFHCFWSSGGKFILDEDYWVVAPGEEVVFYKSLFHVDPNEPKNKGYKSKYAVSALKILAAQYGLNVPITEVPQ